MGQEKAQNRRRWVRALLYVTTVFLLTSCTKVMGDTGVKSAQYEMVAATDVAMCRAVLNAPGDAGRGSLDASNIRLINWNIRKQLDPGAGLDLRNIATGTDLVLIQEASLS